MMTHANIFKIEGAGRDYAVFGNVRYNFDDDEVGTKEEAAAFFRGLVGKDAAIEAAESASDGMGRFYIGVDFIDRNGNNVKVIPIAFAVSSVEVLL
jgi:hypothetical protein